MIWISVHCPEHQEKSSPRGEWPKHLTGATSIYSAFLIVANTPARTPAAAARALAIWWA